MLGWRRTGAVTATLSLLRLGGGLFADTERSGTWNCDCDCGGETRAGAATPGALAGDAGRLLFKLLAAGVF